MVVGSKFCTFVIFLIILYFSAIEVRTYFQLIYFFVCKQKFTWVLHINMFCVPLLISHIRCSMFGVDSFVFLLTSFINKNSVLFPFYYFCFSFFLFYCTKITSQGWLEVVREDRLDIFLTLGGNIFLPLSRIKTVGFSRCHFSVWESSLLFLLC